MIFGTDTARYQALGAYDPGAFEVVNIEDPQFEAKTARNLREGRPTGYYVWIYPGTDVRAFTTWAIGKARAAGANFGAWADYEQDGVTLDLLEAFFAACDAAGERGGYYGNNWRFGHGAFLARPYWYCGYPNPNDGQWRDGYAPGASRSVQIFQFTSGGGLDRNVIWDDDWYSTWTRGDDDMPSTQEIVDALTTPGPYGLSPMEAAVVSGIAKKIAPANGPDGKPWTLLQWITAVEKVTSAQASADLQKALAAALTDHPASGQIDTKQLAADILDELGQRITAQ